jgi:hypothetical protein
MREPEAVGVRASLIEDSFGHLQALESTHGEASIPIISRRRPPPSERRIQRPS